MDNRKNQNADHQNQNESPRAQDRLFRDESNETFSSGARNHLLDSEKARDPRRVNVNWSIENERTYGSDKPWQNPEERRDMMYSQNRYRTRDFSGESDYGAEVIRNSELSHIGKGPKGYQRSDERIREDVSEALYRHPEVDATDIEVKVQSGVVTLTGTVEDRDMKRMAEDTAERIFGVTNVLNLLTIHHNGWFARNPRIP